MLKHQASVLIGKSLFDYHHGGDSEHLSAAFKCCKWYPKVIGLAIKYICGFDTDYLQGSLIYK